MIELVQAPDSNRVIADGNDTLVKIKSTTGGDHYIRATISIDDAEFLQQGWSKDENGLCAFNLKHLYHSYFENEFASAITTGLLRKDELYKKVSITAEEFKVGGTAPVSSITLPEFHIIKNTTPANFDDQATVALLDLPQENINAPRDKGFVFPLFLKAGTLNLTLLNDLGNPIHSEELTIAQTGVFQYEMNFADFPIEDLPYIFVKFSTSQHEVLKKIKFIKHTFYHPTQIIYRNNFGFYCHAFLTGISSQDHDLSPKSYAQFDGTEVTYHVEDLKEISINSGYGYKDITDLLHSIAVSVDVRLLQEGSWERMKSETKNLQRFEDQKFVYSEALKFSRLNLGNYTNANTFAQFPVVVDITGAGDENTEITLTKQQLLAAYTSLYPATKLRIESLPANGQLKYQTDQATFNLSDMVANDPSLLPFDISLDTLIAVKYAPGYTLFGSPLDTFAFKLGSQYLWSNTANFIMNVTDVPDVNLPPDIVVNSIQEVALDGSGNATKLIDAVTFTDPENDPVSVLWEVLNGAPITFDDATLENPTITITGGTAGTPYDLKVTATDTANNLSSEKTIRIFTSSYEVNLSSVEVAVSGETGEYNFNLSGGKPGATVTLKYTFQGYFSNQYALINYNTASERILYGSGTTLLDTVTLSPSGAATIPIQLYNPTSSGGTITLGAVIDSVGSGQIIGQFNNTSRSLNTGSGGTQPIQQ